MFRIKHFQRTRLAFQAWATLLCFTVSLAGDVAPVRAQEILASGVSIDAVRFHPSDMPEQWGAVETFHQGDSGKPFVFLLQDAHAIADAQHSLRKIIEFLEKQFKVRLLLLEGAEGPLDGVLLKTFPDRFIREKVLEEYLQSGDLSGAEQALTDDKTKVQAFGIEDWQIYEDNHRAYLGAMEQKTVIARELENLKRDLEKRRAETFTPELLSLHLAREAFYEEQSNLADVLEVIKSWRDSGKNSSAFSQRYPLIQALLEELEKENTEDLEKDIRLMAESLKSKVEGALSGQEAARFQEAYQNFMTGQMDAGTFLRRMVSVGNLLGFTPRLTPEMKRSMKVSENLSSIQGSAFFHELESAFDETEASGNPSAEVKNILSDFKRLRRLEQISKLAVSREDLKDYRSAPEEHLIFLGTAREKIIPALEFYDLALEREHAFERGIKARMKEQKAESAIVVTGGFHTEGLKEALSRGGYSYAVITPVVNSLEGHEFYEPLMEGNFAYKEYLETTYYDAFVRHAAIQLMEKVPEPEFKQNLKVWRDEVIRVLAAEGRIDEVGQYTHYIDGLFKVYQRKFPSKSEPDEAMRREIEKELESFQQETVNSWRRAFFDAIEKFQSFLLPLEKDNRLSTENVKAVLNAGHAGSHALSVPKALARDKVFEWQGINARELKRVPVINRSQIPFSPGAVMTDALTRLALSGASVSQPDAALSARQSIRPLESVARQAEQAEREGLEMPIVRDVDAAEQSLRGALSGLPAPPSEMARKILQQGGARISQEDSSLESSRFELRSAEPLTTPELLRQRIVSLEASLTERGVHRLPRVGFHGELAGHVPAGDLYYFVADPMLDDYWKKEYRLDASNEVDRWRIVETKVKLERGVLTLQDVFMDPPEFFKRLFGTVGFTANYGGNSPLEGVFPEIYLLRETENLKLPDSSHDKEGATLRYYDPDLGWNEFPFFSLEGFFPASRLDASAVIEKVTLSPAETQTVLSWAAQKAQPGDRGGLGLSAQFYANQILYAKTLEALNGLELRDSQTRFELRMVEAPGFMSYRSMFPELIPYEDTRIHYETPSGVSAGPYLNELNPAIRLSRPVGVRLGGNVFLNMKKAGSVIKVYKEPGIQDFFVRIDDRRFWEMHALSRLHGDSPLEGIPTLKAFGPVDADPKGMIWAEYETLNQAWSLDKNRFQSAAGIISSFVKYARILEEIRKRGWSHNDVKPGNLIIDSEENVQVIDFNFAAPLGENMPGGTVGYSPWENPKTEYTDAFGLGMTLIEIITETMNAGKPNDLPLEDYQRLEDLRAWALNGFFTRWDLSDFPEGNLKSGEVAKHIQKKLDQERSSFELRAPAETPKLRDMIAKFESLESRGFQGAEDDTQGRSELRAGYPENVRDDLNQHLMDLRRVWYGMGREGQYEEDNLYGQIAQAFHRHFPSTQGPFDPEAAEAYNAEIYRILDDSYNNPRARAIFESMRRMPGVDYRIFFFHGSIFDAFREALTSSGAKNHSLEYAEDMPSHPRFFRYDGYDLSDFHQAFVELVQNNQRHMKPNNMILALKREAEENLELIYYYGNVNTEDAARIEESLYGRYYTNDPGGDRSHAFFNVIAPAVFRAGGSIQIEFNGSATEYYPRFWASWKWLRTFSRIWQAVWYSLGAWFPRSGIGRRDLGGSSLLPGQGVKITLSLPRNQLKRVEIPPGTPVKIQSVRLDEPGMLAPVMVHSFYDEESAAVQFSVVSDSLKGERLEAFTLQFFIAGWPDETETIQQRIIELILRHPVDFRPALAEAVPEIRYWVNETFELSSLGMDEDLLRHLALRFITGISFENLIVRRNGEEFFLDLPQSPSFNPQELYALRDYLNRTFLRYGAAAGQKDLPEEGFTLGLFPIKDQNLQRSELREGEELLTQWNQEHYFKQEGKPDQEEGHLGVQFRDVNMETGPGSIYEFDFLKEAAKIFLFDKNLGLSNEKYAAKPEVEKILDYLESEGVIDQAVAKAVKDAFGVLEKAAGKYHADVKLTTLTNRDEFYRDYYQAASEAFRTVPLLVEVMARLSDSGTRTRLYEAEDGLEIQKETGFHFSLAHGFQQGEREQLGLPEGVDAREYFREKPARVMLVYLLSLEFELPLSHAMRLGLRRYLPEYQAWLDEERNQPVLSEAFLQTGRRFLKIMESRQPVIRVLGEMYRLGILEALVPELREVKNMPSNFNVHAFTVGQHTFYNLKKLEDLRVTEDPGLSEGREIAENLSVEEIRQIRLALLLHDLGKRMTKTPVEPDHAIVSSRDIVPIRLKQLGADEDIANVSWVVRDHMVLNAFARMQDSDFNLKLPVLLKTFALDPEVSLERLKLLYLISLTDRDSVNPWFPLMGPEVLERLNHSYQTLEDYFDTSEEDKSRDIEDLQLEAHTRIKAEWQAYKAYNQHVLRESLAALTTEGIRGYFKNVVVLGPGLFEAVRNGLIEKAHAAAADAEVYDDLLERLFAAFSIDQIREYSREEVLERLLFLLHLDYQKEASLSAPVVYFNPQLSRTYERGYEIVIGSATDSEGFFEKITGVLLRHGFDIEEADIRTLDGGRVVDTFQGFFHGDYPGEREHIRMQDQLTLDLQDVLSGKVSSVEDLFEREQIPYRSERTEGPLRTEMSFLQDTNIYGTRASVFNLKTANRLGLLHALSLILKQHGVNLVAAPVSTHPAMVNDTFYVNRGGEVLSEGEKKIIKEEVEKVVSQASIDLASLRSELRSEDAQEETLSDTDFTQSEIPGLLHDLRNSLGALTMYMDILASVLPEEAVLNEVFREYSQLQNILFPARDSSDVSIDEMREIFQKLMALTARPSVEAFKKILEEHLPAEGLDESERQYQSDLKASVSALLDDTWFVHLLARGALGLSDRRLEEVDIHAVLNRIISMNSRLKEVTVKEYDPGSLKIFDEEGQVSEAAPTLLSYEISLLRILKNLIGNALYAIKDKGTEGKIYLRTKFTAQEMRLEVADNGVGIAPENLENIWRPYFTTKGSEGTGLGLDIVKKMVEAQLGGSIEVKSVVGEGTTFTLRLPRKIPAREETPEPLLPEGLLSRGIKFLTPEMYRDIRENGFSPPNARPDQGQGIPSKFPDKVSFSISQDRLFRSSSTHEYGPFSSSDESAVPLREHAAFVLKPQYVRENADQFQLAGRLLDQNESFRKEYSKGLALLGLDEKQVYIKTNVAFPDEIHADFVPGEAIESLIVNESLAPKIREWDQRFNLEPLPLYLVSEDRFARELTAWEPSEIPEPSRQAGLRSELRSEDQEPPVLIKDKGSRQQLWERIVNNFGLEKVTTGGTTKVYRSTLYEDFFLKKKEIPKSEIFRIEAPWNTEDEYTAVSAELARRKLGVEEKPIFIQMEETPEASPIRTNMTWQRKVTPMDHAWDAYTEKRPEFAKAVFGMLKKLWQAGYFDADFKMGNMGIYTRDEVKRAVGIIDFDFVYQLPETQDPEMIYAWLKDRDFKTNGRLHIAPGEHFLINVFYYEHDDDSDSRAQRREVARLSFLRKVIFPDQDPDAIRLAFSAVYGKAKQAYSGLGLTADEKKNPPIEKVREVKQVLLTAMAADPVIDRALRQLAESIVEVRKVRSELRSDPDFSEQKEIDDLNVLTEVLRAYGLEGTQVELVSEDKTNIFMVTSENQKFILKKPKYRKTADLIEWEAALLESLTGSGLKVSRILPTLDGRTFVESEGNLFVLYEFAQGQSYGWGEIEGENLETAGAVLARLHDAARDLSLPGKPYSLTDLPPIIPFVGMENRLKKIEEFYTQLSIRGPPQSEGEQFFLQHQPLILEAVSKIRSRLTAQTVESLPKTLVHGDYHQGNAVFTPEGILLFDFEYARLDARIRDFSNAILLRYQDDGTSLDLDKIGAFLHAYQKTTRQPLTNEELELLPEVFRLGYLEFLLAVMEGSFSFEKSKGALEEQIKNLQKIETVDWEALAKNILSLEETASQPASEDLEGPASEVPEELGISREEWLERLRRIHLFWQGENAEKFGEMKALILKYKDVVGMRSMVSRLASSYLSGNRASFNEVAGELFIVDRLVDHLSEDYEVEVLGLGLNAGFREIDGFLKMTPKKEVLSSGKALEAGFYILEAKEDGAASLNGLIQETRQQVSAQIRNARFLVPAGVPFRGAIIGVGGELSRLNPQQGLKEEPRKGDEVPVYSFVTESFSVENNSSPENVPVFPEEQIQLWDHQRLDINNVFYKVLVPAFGIPLEVDEAEEAVRNEALRELIRREKTQREIARKNIQRKKKERAATLRELEKRASEKEGWEETFQEISDPDLTADPALVSKILDWYFNRPNLALEELRRNLQLAAVNPDQPGEIQDVPIREVTDTAEVQAVHSLQFRVRHNDRDRAWQWLKARYAEWLAAQEVLKETASRRNAREPRTPPAPRVSRPQQDPAAREAKGWVSSFLHHPDVSPVLTDADAVYVENVLWIYFQDGVDQSGRVSESRRHLQSVFADEGRNGAWTWVQERAAEIYGGPVDRAELRSDANALERENARQVDSAEPRSDANASVRESVRLVDRAELRILQANAARTAAARFENIDFLRNFSNLSGPENEASLRVLENYPVENLIHDFIRLSPGSRDYKLTVIAMSLNYSLWAYKKIRELYFDLDPVNEEQKRKDIINILRTIQYYAVDLESDPGSRYQVINRRTWDRRSDLTLPIIEKMIEAQGENKEILSVGDFAVSDGTSAYELALHFEQSGRKIKVTGYDKLVSLHFLKRPNRYIVFDNTFRVVQILAYNGSVLRANTRPNAFAGIQFLMDEIKSSGLEPLRDQGILETVSLINPEAQAYAQNRPEALEFKAHDVFEPLEERHEIIRVLGLLMRGQYSYFSDQRIQEALIQLGRGVSAEGFLMNGTLWQGAAQLDSYRRAGEELLYDQTLSLNTTADGEWQRIDLRSELREEPEAAISAREREVLLRWLPSLDETRVVRDVQSAGGVVSAADNIWKPEAEAEIKRAEEALERRIREMLDMFFQTGNLEKSRAEPFFDDFKGFVNLPDLQKRLVRLTSKPFSPGVSKSELKVTDSQKTAARFFHNHRRVFEQAFLEKFGREINLPEHKKFLMDLSFFETTPFESARRFIEEKRAGGSLTLAYLKSTETRPGVFEIFRLPGLLRKAYTLSTPLSLSRAEHAETLHVLVSGTLLDAGENVLKASGMFVPKQLYFGTGIDAPEFVSLIELILSVESLREQLGDHPGMLFPELTETVLGAVFSLLEDLMNTDAVRRALATSA